MPVFPSTLPYSDDQKQQHVSSWQASGQSKKTYSEQQGIRYSTFKDWVKKYTSVQPVIAREEKMNFVSLEVSSPAVAGSGYAEIHYPNGSRLIIHKAIPAEELRRLLS